MIKILKFFLVILIFVLPITWISNFPGEVRILWKNYFIETNVISLAIFILIFTLIIISSYIFYTKIKNIPKSFLSKKKERYSLLGNKALTNLTKALALEDRTEIDQNARKIKKFYGNTILPGFLLTQSALINNDFERAKKYLKLLQREPEGKLIALRGLIKIAIKENKKEDAKIYLKQAKTIEPNNLWILDKLSILLAKSEKWQEAAKILENRGIKDSDMQNNRAVFLMKSGASPSDVWNVSDNIIPAALNAIEFHLNNDDENKAFEIIKKSWKKLQYVKMIELFMTKDVDDVKIALRRFKLVLKALKSNLSSDETKFGMAIAAFHSSLWGETKKYLDKISKKNWDSRIIELWNDLSKNTKRIKIPDFPDDLASAPRWVCNNCGHETDEWKASCEECKEVGKIFWSKSISPKSESKFLDSLF